MGDEDYLAMLGRAKEKLPDTMETHERFELPDLDIIQEGKITIFRNFMDVAVKLRRDPEHLLQYLLKELGAPGNIEDRRVVFKAKIRVQDIDDRVRAYTETYVICSECARPDTRMEKDDRTLMLVCEACGARRPIHVRKAARTDINTLRAGDIIEVTIDSVGKRGDGMSKYMNYMIIVPGTKQGMRTNIKITNISGTTAFGQVTTDPVTR